MPFKKLGENRFRSPSGKILTKKEVEAYYASVRRNKKTSNATTTRRKS